MGGGGIGGNDSSSGEQRLLTQCQHCHEMLGHFDAVAKIIKLPEDHVISFMIAVGKGTQPAWPKPGQLSYDDVVIRDAF